MNPDCIGADGIKEIRAEYAANRLRAEETYIGERMCLKGTISGFGESKLFIRVVVKVGEEVRFYLSHRDPKRYSSRSEATEKQKQTWPGWREWMMSSSVGDTIEAECKLYTFTPTKEDPRRERGIPLFSSCKRVVDGAIWTPSTPTPVPPPTLLPCRVFEYSDSTWSFEIDCPAGKVFLGRTRPIDGSGQFDFLSDGDSATIFVEYHSDSYEIQSSRFIDEHPTTWSRWVERDPTGDSVGEMWEAPQDLADEIISYWRRGEIYAIQVAVECCRRDRATGRPMTVPSCPA